MRERTVEVEIASELRRLRRFGVRHVEWMTTGKGKLRARAKVQDGRSHRTVTTVEHAVELDALRELADGVVAAAPARRARRPVTARTVARPEVR